MTQALSLMEIARLTWDKVPNKNGASFEDYCVFLNKQKEDIWIICSENGSLEGMIAAKNTNGNLYVTMFVTLTKGCFEEFISRANEFFGEIKTVEFLRRRKIRKLNFQRMRKFGI